MHQGRAGISSMFVYRCVETDIIVYSSGVGIAGSVDDMVFPADPFEEKMPYLVGICKCSHLSRSCYLKKFKLRQLHSYSSIF